MVTLYFTEVFKKGCCWVARTCLHGNMGSRNLAPTFLTSYLDQITIHLSNSGRNSSSNGVGKGGSSSKSDNDDDDTEVAGVPPVSDLLWEDDDLRCQTLNALNHMRRNRHFCDVTLQVSRTWTEKD